MPRKILEILVDISIAAVDAMIVIGLIVGVGAFVGITARAICAIGGLLMLGW